MKSGPGWIRTSDQTVVSSNLIRTHFIETSTTDFVPTLKSILPYYKGGLNQSISHGLYQFWNTCNRQQYSKSETRICITSGLKSYITSIKCDYIASRGKHG